MPAGVPVADVARNLSPRLAKQALAAFVDDRMVDLTVPLEADATVRFVTPDAPEALTLYRHSTAHLMAAAVTALFPEAYCGIGPAIEDGFFYDFVVNRPFVPDDLEAIEQKMTEIARQDLRYERKMMSKAEAKAYFDGRGEPLKVQLIEEKGGPEVSCYTIEDAFIDFCTGPHVPSTGRLKAFKVLSSSNAYWKGDARNQPMQRIYGTAFFKSSELTAHLHRIEEAKKRDHRKLGKELGLFTFHPWAPGAPFWQAKGATLYRLLSDYMREALSGEGYQEVRTPLVFNKALWETSGHWEHYRENMVLVESDGEPYALKAMNCPGHMLMFASEGRSYRDLPLRFHDQGVLHRNEASGVLSGLTRVRQFAQDDAHCFITEDQIGEEVERLLRLVDRVYADFGLAYEVELSTRPDDYLGTAETWDHAEAQLKAAIEATGTAYAIAEGDGSFYGPKIDLHVTDALGRRWQCADDSARPPDAGTLRPEVHRRRQRRAPAGADPPRHFRQLRALHRAADRAVRRRLPALARAGAGTDPDNRRPPRRTWRRGARPDRWRRVPRRAGRSQEKIGLKIREAQLQKIPYMLVVGDREVDKGTVAVRNRTAGDQGSEHGERSRAGAPRRGPRQAEPGGGAHRVNCLFAAEPRTDVTKGAANIPPGRGSRGPRRDFRQPRTRINERIRVREIRVIDDQGKQLGVMGPPEALAIAREQGLDLVEISPTAQPPVCRIMDFGRYQYEEQKRSRQARKHQKTIEVKEIKFRPKVDEHDYQFKKKHVERFLAHGDKVKATIFFRGREMAHPEFGRHILDRLIDDLQDIALQETMPRMEGNQMHTILSSRTATKKGRPT